MSCDEHVELIKRLAEAMRAFGVAQYQHDGLVLILGSPPFVDAAPPPFEDEEAQRRQAALLFAASEGL